MYVPGELKCLYICILRFEALMAVKMLIVVLRVVTLCGL
jgi:hypothetical protein